MTGTVGASSLPATATSAGDHSAAPMGQHCLKPPMFVSEDLGPCPKGDLTHQLEEDLGL